ncbi:MAG: PEP-CTERM sorting domain-containing protein [Burkholderiaceae bacterium]|nr:PEP-CTERM sorting domain-containing protein [Burkholderiaceae bacterium]
MNNSLIRGAAAVTLSLCALGAHAAGFGSNLIVNGDAEAGVSGWTGFDGTDLFQSVDYGSNWVKPSEPGPVNRGAKMFAGESSPYSAGAQTVDVGALTGAFASGKASFELSGYLGGWSSQGDNALLLVSFLDASSQSLGLAQLGPVTPADRGNQTGLLFRSTSGFVPVNTAKIEFILSMERLNSSDNDGYADNLSFVLNTAPVPEPGTYALMFLGLGLLAAVKRRKA